MSKKLFKETEKVRTHIQLSKSLKEALEPYLILHGTNLTQLIHSQLLVWLSEQKKLHDHLKNE